MLKLANQKNSLLRRFLSKESGQIAVIFALSLLPVMAIIGFAIDLQTATRQQSRAQMVLDSALLAAAKTKQAGGTDAEIKESAQAYIDSMFAKEPGGLSCAPAQIDPVTQNDDISGELSCSQKTTISQVIGRSEIAFKVGSDVTYGVGKLDVSFVFDISGSMNSSGKLDDLKDAAKEAVEILLPAPGASNDGEVRIAMTSYNNMVNAGEYFESVTGLKAKRTYVDYKDVCVRYWWWGTCREYGTEVIKYNVDSTCVWERNGNEAFTDGAPKMVKNNGSALKEVAANTLNAAVSTNNTEGYLAAGHAWYDRNKNTWMTAGLSDCRSATPYALSDNKTQLNKYITDLSANGGTAGQQGIAWGWYLISPEWEKAYKTNSKPLAYDEPDSTKVIIVMTDGEFNSQYFGELGSSFDQAKALCNSIKAKDVRIYTVAFQAPNAGKEILEYCASGPEFAFTPSDGQQLTDAYRAIASSISDLRIKQ